MSGATYYKFNMELPMLWVNLKEFDNDKLADIIISKGDVQNKETNVKANMTGWRLDLEHEEVNTLANKAIDDAPIANPFTIFNKLLCVTPKTSWYKKMSIVKPNNANPTTNIPTTVPPEKATFIEKFKFLNI